MSRHLHLTPKVPAAVPNPLTKLRSRIADVTAGTFDQVALDVFKYQRVHNDLYARYLNLIGWEYREASTWIQIPTLPISFFRQHDVKSGDWEAQTVFESSGTTGANTSRHHVRHLDSYQRACAKTFQSLCGPLSQWRLLALLPNYLERGQSGLVAMVDDFACRAAPGSGFYLHDTAKLRKDIDAAIQEQQPVLLWGVTFALLSLIKQNRLVLPEGSLIIETGGMKGRGPERTRDQVHQLLNEAITTTNGSPAPIASEYGMTELMSQAYLLPGSQRFIPAPTMRVRPRDVTDPFSLVPRGKSGALDIIDLANLDTCAFIQTDDVGRAYADGSFEVLGRKDGSQVRGCNLLSLE